MQGCFYPLANVARSLSLLQRIEVVGWPTTESSLNCSFGLHTIGLLMSNLASITMCSHFAHLLVAIYRRIQILFPSLGTLVDGDPRERVDSFVCPLDSLVCPLDSLVCSLEVQDGLGSCPWAASSGGSFPEVFPVVPESDFL